jgi:hypothetical protein
MKWHDFERMACLVYLFVETGHHFKHEHWSTFFSSCWTVVRAAHEVKGAYRKKPEHATDSWFKSLAWFGSQGCSDDRDRIYALLGLLPLQSQSRLSIKPDYSKHANEIYREVAALALGEERIMQNMGRPAATNICHLGFLIIGRPLSTISLHGGCRMGTETMSL